MFFFYKQKTGYEMRISDWSSDVCSSDLERAKQDAAVAEEGDEARGDRGEIAAVGRRDVERGDGAEAAKAGRARMGGQQRQMRGLRLGQCVRSEARREGNEWASPCRARWSPTH